ncbi:MAG: protein serine/threonine phosphatase [Chlamydiales bacterium]|jgi:sigma-B regulation protein RsbU (phosphoserine phosphatase)|nr:protein serine/threonine phosphatase [Chlamydiales bacterium]
MMETLFRLSIRTKSAISIILIAIALVGVFTTSSVKVKQQISLKLTDDTLLIAACFVKNYLDEEFQKIGITEPSKNKQAACYDQLYNYIQRVGVYRLGSVINVQGDFRLTTNAILLDDLNQQNQQLTPYLSAFERKSNALDTAWATGNIQYEFILNGDKYFRVIYLPAKNAQNNPYLIIAEKEFIPPASILSPQLAIVLILGTIICMLGVWVNDRLIRKVSYSIQQLVFSAEKLILERFDHGGAIHSGSHTPQISKEDEIESLASSFDWMQGELHHYLSGIEQATTTKENIRDELSVACNIQLSLVPQYFPAFPDRKEFDIYAFLQPAKEMGGDLYDFYFIDHDHLLVSIGDVSDKGVPAALLMAVTKIFTKAKSEKGMTSGQILALVNKELNYNNASCMFVTFFLGILHLPTGYLQYSIAGHNPPYILHKNGSLEMIATPPSPALGVVDDIEYPVHETLLIPGDRLFLYTDGVNEALNIEGELYSYERLDASLKKLYADPLKDFVKKLVDEIKLFRGDAPQSDDITVVLLEYKGPAN